MKRSTLSVLLGLVFSVALATVASAGPFSFQTIIYPGDTFTQLLGINNAGLIVGYHGATVNQGFALTLPSAFASENYPGAAQTQVVAIAQGGGTAGFYVDAGGTTHGFRNTRGKFSTVDFPGTTFNQLLGLNMSVAVGYYADSSGNDHPYSYSGQSGVFSAIVLPGAVSAQATGVTARGAICGFYIDGAGINHGFILHNAGKLTTLDYPGATATQALGINNFDQVVGFYLDSVGLSHGFVYNYYPHPVFHTVDAPGGSGTTVINGINSIKSSPELVGFYVDSSGNTDGFVATVTN